jgi:hypothetical protein
MSSRGRKKTLKHTPNQSKQKKTMIAQIEDESQATPQKTMFGFSKTVTMDYAEPDAQYLGSGNFLLAATYKLSDIFDPSNAPFSASVTGFNEMGSIYKYFRAIGFKFSYTISNRESFPLQAFWLLSPTNIAPAFSSRAVAVSYLERVGVVASHELSAQGGQDRATFETRWLKQSKILGDEENYNLWDFTGSNVSGPTRTVYLHLVLIAPATITNITNGVFINFRLDFSVKWFSVFEKFNLFDTLCIEYAMKALSNLKSMIDMGYTPDLVLQFKTYLISLITSKIDYSDNQWRRIPDVHDKQQTQLAVSRFAHKFPHDLLLPSNISLNNPKVDSRQAMRMGFSGFSTETNI